MTQTKGALVVLVRLSANWYNVQPFKISAGLQVVEWRMLLSGKIFPGGRKYLRLRLRSMPGCLCSHQIPIQTFTPICNAASPALFSYLSWEGGVPVEKKPVYKCRNEYKKKTKETLHLHVVLCRTYSSLDFTFKLPIASFTRILATSSVLVLSFIKLSSFELLRTSKWYIAYNKFCKNIWWNLGICPNHQASRRFRKVLF